MDWTDASHFLGMMNFRIHYFRCKTWGSSCDEWPYCELTYSYGKRLERATQILYHVISSIFGHIYVFWIICLIWYLWCQVWQRNLTMMLGNWILVAVALRIFNYTWLLTLSLLSQNRPHISFWSGYPLLITSLVYVGWFFRVISQSQSVWLA